MHRIVDIVAPRSLLDLIFKAVVICVCFTCFELLVGYLTRGFPVGYSTLITFLSAAPFGLFVMTILKAQRDLKERLQYLSSTDVLTGLLNRRTFFERADDLLEAGENVVVLMVDLDFFKKVNDTYGHRAGDIALIAAGQHLQATTRDCDVVGRIGGEEFAILLRIGDLQSVDEIVANIFEPIKVQPRDDTPHAFAPFEVTMSIGAVIAEPDVSLNTLLELADEALYFAKKTGRNIVLYHTADIMSNKHAEAG